MAETISVRGIGGRARAGTKPLGFERPTLLGVGTMIWLGSETMFFAGLFAAYYTVRAHNVGVWPPPPVKLDLVDAGIFSIILLLSSVTMQYALWHLEHGRRRAARTWLIVTFAMGLAFLCSQGAEWMSVSYSTSTNSYSSMFFVMTGLHGLHVALGLVCMIALLGRMVGPEGDPGEQPVFQAVSYYWHFVDIMWIGIFSSLFLIH